MHCTGIDMNEEDLVYRLKKRAEIRRQISSRKSVQEGKEDRISSLLDEAAAEIEKLRKKIKDLNQMMPYDDGPMIKMFRD